MKENIKKGMKLRESVIGIMTFLVLVIFVSGCASETGNKTTGGNNQLKIVSSAFNQGETIPSKYTADGADMSPPLSWSSVPEGTKSFAIILVDLDAPGGEFVHWILFNLPVNVKEIHEGIPNQGTLENGAKQGKNDFGKIGYSGPSPPSGTHRYLFKLYALDSELNLDAGVSKGDFIKAMEGHTIDVAQLTGKYGK